MRGADVEGHIWTSRKKPKQQEQEASASGVGARGNEQKSFCIRKGRHSEGVPELEASSHVHELLWEETPFTEYCPLAAIIHIRKPPPR